MTWKISFALSVLTLCLIFSVWTNIRTTKQNAALSALLSEKGSVLLTPSLTQMLLSDLESADKTKLQEWQMFLYQYTKRDTNYSAASEALEDTLALYKSRESPSRSNYFNRMVFELHTKLANAPLSKQALLIFLGPPDVTSEVGHGQVLDYGYWCEGSHWFAQVTVTNQMVRSIEICTDPR